MKICIWFKITNNPWGGGNQFLRALASELTAMGHEVSHSPGPDAELILLNAHNAGPGITLHPNQVAQLRQTGRASRLGGFIPPRWWLWRRRRGPVLVHRLDGVAELIRGHRTEADVIQPAVNHLTDFTVFQSAYSRESFAAYQVRPPRSCIIYNGVDPAIFFPVHQKHACGRRLCLVASSWSANPRKGFATLAAISAMPDVELRFVGNWCPTVAPENVVLLGSQPSPEVAEIFRQSDAMVHAAENEPCSNAILEALACGLPVLYLDSGGNRELAGEYGVPLSGEPQQDIAQLRSKYGALREKARADRPRFLIHHAAQKYVEAFQEALDLGAM